MVRAAPATVRIALGDGQIALCDLGDFGKVRGLPWRSNGRYAVADVAGKHLLMHRVILGLTDGEIGDHIDANGFDNRRANIRKCTPGQNVMNRRKLIVKTSRFKGVYRVPDKRKWAAKIVVEGVTEHIGMFDTQIEAAKAYDRIAPLRHGQFAKTNKQLGLY